jgi:dUTP pyrophosphatase
MNNMQIKFKKLNPLAKMPTRANNSDAGNDLYAIEDVIIEPGERKIIKTGIAVAIPEGFYGRVAPRSGLAWKNGLDVMAGVIDSAYRGEIGVVLINLSLWVPKPISIKAGDKVAQLIIERCEPAEWEEVESLDETSRGAGGYGSSGT